MARHSISGIDPIEDFCVRKRATQVEHREDVLETLGSRKDGDISSIFLHPGRSFWCSARHNGVDRDVQVSVDAFSNQLLEGRLPIRLASSWRLLNRFRNVQKLFEGPSILLQPSRTSPVP